MRRPQRPARPAARARHQRGGALPLALAIALVLVLGAGAIWTLGQAQLAKAQAQTAADLTALSAGRALQAALPGLGDGRPAERRGLQAALTDVGREVAAGAGADLVDLRLASGAWPPTAVQVTVSERGPQGTRLRATARAGLAVGTLAHTAAGGLVGQASGGGYSGPLVYRDGKPICPAVAAAFDLMDAAANADGLDLVVVSGFRSDAEQAVLFARNPDPKWVAPPGRSRHRDATEVDLALGPGTHAWLARHAGAFGFLQRYSWEPWHWGYLPGCGAPAAGAVGAGAPADAGVPSWVPARYAGLIGDSARREGVPPPLLAALLRAESSFDPRAVSHMGAQGIAQFMPGTARGMGLADPFDPEQAIPAAARLLAGHLRQFGSVPLALAAYNAGPGAVTRYGGVPPYRETQAYVARILGIMGGVPVLGAPGGGVVLLRAGERLV